MGKFEIIVLRWVVIVLIPVVAGLSLIVKDVVDAQEESSPFNNGYVQPYNDLGGLIDYAQKSTVTISCSSSQGSGFGFALLEEDEAEWNFEVPKIPGSLILTNNHVVQECVESASEIRIEYGINKQITAQIMKTDELNDIAVLWVRAQVKPLSSTIYALKSGWWVLATGSPFLMQGTSTFGNIINIEENKIYTSASLNKGNSGGPLLDNEGLVIGINTGYRALAQNINWAIDINALCENLVVCNSEIGLLHPLN